MPWTKKFTPREVEICNLISQGYSNENISGKMNIGYETVKVHLKNIFAKQGVKDRTNLAIAVLNQKQLANDFKALLQSTSNVAFVKDIEGRYLMVNDSFLEKFGLKMEEVFGRTDYEIFPEEIAEEYVLNDREVLKTGQSLNFEEIGVYKDDISHALVNKFPLKSIDNKTIGVVGICIDIRDKSST